QSDDKKAVDNTALHSLCVSRVPIFNHLPDEELTVIAEKANMRVYERGQFIHRSGEVSDQLFIVHKGAVKVYRLSKSGKEQLVRFLQPGDFSGELSLFRKQSMTLMPRSQKHHIFVPLPDRTLASC